MLPDGLSDPDDPDGDDVGVADGLSVASLRVLAVGDGEPLSDGDPEGSDVSDDGSDEGLSPACGSSVAPSVGTSDGSGATLGSVGGTVGSGSSEGGMLGVGSADGVGAVEDGVGESTSADALLSGVATGPPPPSWEPWPSVLTKGSSGV